MSMTRKLFLWVVFLMLAAAGVPVSANEVYDSTISNMLAEQAQRIQQLETQVASLSQHGGGGDFCDDCCDRCPGVIAGAELTFLKAHNNALSLAIAPLGAGNIIPGYDFEVAPRFWAGYEFAGGLGFRATYWGFDQSVTSNVLPITVGLEATTVDLELTQSGSFCKWDLTFSAGARYGRIDDSLALSFGGPPISLSHEFEGVGGTIAFGVRRPVGYRGLSLIGGLRASLLYGSTDASVDLSGLNFPVTGVTLTNDQQVLEIYEMRMGGEWSRDLDNGARFYAQVLYEAQAWNIAPILLGIGDSQIGFSGVAVNVGLAR
ncbi:MAG: hypothetical protein U0935_24135 [Pirellulales bacterium]